MNKRKIKKAAKKFIWDFANIETHTFKPMNTQETIIQKVTIMPKDGDVGMSFDAEVLLHRYDIDGSQIIVLKTPRRESVTNFLNIEKKKL